MIQWKPSGPTEPMRAFTKYASGAQVGQPLYEAAGLRWLSEGGAPTPSVLSVTPDTLVTAFVPSSSPDPKRARALGRRLARAHASGAPWFGSPPPGYSGHGWMGLASLVLLDEPTSNSWGQFYSHCRLRPYMRGTDARTRDLLEAVCEALEAGKLDHSQPSLVVASGHEAARIHGDLWSGNILWADPEPILIDPAAQGGHAETDLATLLTFGTPHYEDVIAGYQGISSLAEGWRDRVGLHQLHMLVVHCYLFGSSYAPATRRAATSVLALI